MTPLASPLSSRAPDKTTRGKNLSLPSVDLRKGQRSQPSRCTLPHDTAHSQRDLKQKKTIKTKQNKKNQKQLKDLKQELAALRVAKVTGGAANKLAKIKSVRKGVARVLTVISQERRQAIRSQLAGSKYLPLDLRPKKTRAIRKRLTKHPREAKTVKAAKKAAAFPRRKYAVKA